MAVLDYAARTHPGLRRHLSVQGSATTAPALRYAYARFGIRRAVLPRVLSIQQVERPCEKSPVAIEAFAFGSPGIMEIGRAAVRVRVWQAGSFWVVGVSINKKK